MKRPTDKEKSSRRSFIEQLTALGLLSSLPGSNLLAKDRTDNVNLKQEDFIPYLQLLTPTSAVIRWIDFADNLSWLTLNDGLKEVDVFQITDGFAKSGIGVKEFQLSDLQPDTHYSYQIKSKTIRQYKAYDIQYDAAEESEKYHFTTPSSHKSDMACIILNDLHDRPSSYQELLRLEDSDYDFLVLNGDTFNYLENENQLFKNLFFPLGRMIKGAKQVVFSRGNHETRGTFSRQLKKYFSYPDNTFYHSFVKGNVRFIVLDAGEDKPDQEPVYAGLAYYDQYRQEQAKWLTALLQKKRSKAIKYQVVIMHIPPFHSGDWHGTMHCREVFHPIFEKYKIDLLVSGHTHRAGFHSRNQAHNYPILIGGAPEEGKRTIIKLSSSEKGLLATLRKDDGTLLAQEWL